MRVNSSKDVAEEYTSSLADLTINSKPLINMLTMLAEDYIEHAPIIVQVVEHHLQKIACDSKLPALYLIDSIVKNVGKTYIPLFTQNIVSTFCAVFEKVDEKVRSQMFKLRQTWNDVFPPKKLFALDVRVHAIDPAWPITATPQSVRIHVNPKFLQAHVPSSSATPTPAESSQPISDGVMREELLKQQKELLELQKRKVELELLQTKAILEEQQKKLENQAAGFISEPVVDASTSVSPETTTTVTAQPFSSSGQTTPIPHSATTHVQTTNSKNKSYKSSASSFRARDPRIKFNKDKTSENRTKANTTQKESSLNIKQEGKSLKKEKKSFKKPKERHNSDRNQVEKANWVKTSTDTSASVKKQLRRFDKVLLTKLPSEEPPPPGVDVITCITENYMQSKVDNDKDVQKVKDTDNQAISAISSAVVVTAPSTISASNAHHPTGIVASVNEETSRHSDINENGIITNDRTPTNTTVGNSSTVGGLKRCHSRSPSPSESSLDPELQANISAQPPKKKSPALDTPYSPSSNFTHNDEIVAPTNLSKDVDLRLLPSPNKNVTEEPHNPVKQSRAEILDTLFGDEDVDLRTFAPMVRSPQHSNKILQSSNLPSLTDESNSRGRISPMRISESPVTVALTVDTLQQNLSPSSNSAHPNPASPNSMTPRTFSPSPVALHSASSNLTPPIRDVTGQNSSAPVSALLTTTQTNLLSNNSTNQLSNSLSAQDNNFGQASLVHHAGVGNISGTPPICVTPSPPPPPIISKEYAAEESSWANYKRTKSEEGGSNSTPVDSVRRSKKERTPKALFRSNGLPEEKESEQEVEERSSANCNLIIKEAEHQLSTGNITFSQYNRMLKEVIAINEERKLKEALRKDESYELDNPSETLGEEDTDNHLTSDKQETQLNGLQAMDTQPDRNDKDVDSSKSEDYPTTKDVRSRRTYYNKEHSESRSRSNSSGSHTTERYGLSSSHQSSSSGWENRSSHKQNHSQSTGNTQRSSWYGRGLQPQLSHKTTSRSNNSNYPVWMATPTAPQLPVFYPANFRYSGPVTVKKPFVPPVRAHPQRRQDVPPADPHVLELIEKDTMRPIKIDGIVREVRFYGETAVIMLTWDEPREVLFQPGSRRLIIDDSEHFLLHFNSPYRDCLIDGHIFKIRLGAPTREIFIDGLYYEMIFGGPPVQIVMGGRPRMVQLGGPMPKVRIGEVPRTDLVAGKINLIVDAKQMFPIYLDAKPQRFEVGGVPYILRFVEALQTVVINGVPFKFDFGGVPVPIFFHGEKHFLRLSVLPAGIRPGYITIVNMEGGRLPSPAPADVTVQQPAVGPPVVNTTGNLFSSEINSYKVVGSEQPLELLTSLMPTAMAPLAGHSYAVEHAPTSSSAVTPAPASGGPNLGNINVGELFQKLVASGIVPPVGQKETTSTEEEDGTAIKVVDFSKPETLKVKQPGLVARLYSGIQCSSCGVRFPPEQTVKYSQHLDWHFRQNRRERISSRVPQSRRWNYDVSDWIQYQEIEDVDDRAASWFEMQEKKKSSDTEDDVVNEPSVVAGEGAEQAACRVCHDKFDQFYNEEKEEWHLRKAVRIEDDLYHPLCYQDLLENRARLDPPEPTTVLEDEEPIIIEDCITLDDSSTPISNPIEDNTKNSYDNKDITPVETEPMDDNSDIEIEPIQPQTIESPMDISSLPDNEKTEITEQQELEEHESDDDILQIEVVEQKIESYEILDDEEENDSSKCNHLTISQMKQPDVIPDEDNDEDIDFARVKVKTEKIDLARSDHITVPNHITVVSSIDGNVELDEATPIVLPRNKIKINISSKHMANTRTTITETNIIETSLNVMEPPPPGEELFPASLKPKLVGQKMKICDTVCKGSDSSGLCSIM
uniref:Pre-mRNA cleavage complex 2 protein Pcf11 n=1 Tax=Panstrongylus lignarius TaxID=156445 RepID=A0A224X4V7_9HEMI